MTSFHGLSALKAIALGAALSMTAGFAFAADSNVSADQIVNALRAKSPTRGLSAAPQTDPAARAKEAAAIRDKNPVHQPRDQRVLHGAERRPVLPLQACEQVAAMTEDGVDAVERADLLGLDVLGRGCPNDVS